MNRYPFHETARFFIGKYRIADLDDANFLVAMPSDINPGVFSSSHMHTRHAILPQGRLSEGPDFHGGVQSESVQL